MERPSLLWTLTANTSSFRSYHRPSISRKENPKKTKNYSVESKKPTNTFQQAKPGSREIASYMQGFWTKDALDEEYRRLNDYAKKKFKKPAGPKKPPVAAKPMEKKIKEKKKSRELVVSPRVDEQYFVRTPWEYMANLKKESEKKPEKWVKEVKKAQEEEYTEEEKYRSYVFWQLDELRKEHDELKLRVHEVRAKIKENKQPSSKIPEKSPSWLSLSGLFTFFGNFFQKPKRKLLPISKPLEKAKPTPAKVKDPAEIQAPAEVKTAAEVEAPLSDARAPPIAPTTPWPNAHTHTTGYFRFLDNLMKEDPSQLEEEKRKEPPK